MKCGKCGNELENNALICPFCGQAVPDEAQADDPEGISATARDEILQEQY